MNNENKKNILIVHNYYQISGGEDTVVANEKKMLEKHGHKVSLYSRSNVELKQMSKLQKVFLPITTVFNPKTYKEIKNLIRQESRQIRKEVGLSALNQISANEALGFWVNGVAMNPKQKNIAHQMNYKIIMLKIDLFFMNRIHGVFINWCFYKLIKPVGGIIYCIFKYILGGTVIILKNLLNKQKEIKKS